MRWLFVVVLGCGGPGPPLVAVHAELPATPVATAEPATIAIDGSVISCGGVHAELPVALVITGVSDREVVAAATEGVIRVARTTEAVAASLLQTWADLHVQLEGALAFGTQVDAQLSYRDGTLVIDYAMAHGARLRFAYRRTHACTFAAIERAAEPVGAVRAIAGDEQMSWEPVTDLMKAAAAYECWSHAHARC